MKKMIAFLIVVLSVSNMYGMSPRAAREEACKGSTKGAHCMWATPGTPMAPQPGTCQTDEYGVLACW